MLRKFLRLAPLVAFVMLSFLSLSPAEAATGTFVSPLSPNPNVYYSPVVDSKYYQVIVDKETQVVTVLQKDEAGKYTVIERQMVCSTGVPPRTYPGTYKINKRLRWLHSNAKNGHPASDEPFAVCFNDPIWFHGVLYKNKNNPESLMPDSYLGLGQPISAGCIRLCVRDARWIYMNCPNGTVVIVKKSGGPAPVCVEPLPPLPDGATYDPTDPLVVK